MQLKDTQYTGYKISDDGRLWSNKSNKFLKPSLDKDGYIKFGLSIAGKVKTCYAHRLVAQAFIPNPHNLPQVNHKDENKINNNVNNLQWCDSNYNNNYGQHNTKISETKKRQGCTGKTVFMCDKNTGEKLKRFVSASEAARFLGHPGVVNGILKCAKHTPNYQTSFGYKWEFE